MKMKSIRIIVIALLVAANFGYAQDTIYIHKGGEVVYMRAISQIDSMTFNHLTPVTQVYQDSLFSKIYSSLMGLNGTTDVPGFADQANTNFIRQIFNLNELTTDEALCTWSDEGIPELNSNQWTSATTQIGGLYGRLYFEITLCNKFLSETSGKTDTASLRQRAEARFIRALSYYYLLDFFGNVPFTLGTTYADAPQMNRAYLFNFIDSELADCEASMYEPLQAPYGRADKASNWLLRSRLLLNAVVYTGTAHWADAAANAKKVLNSGYALCPTYAHLFMADNNGAGTVNKANQEIMLAIPADGANTKSWSSSLFLIASTHSSDMGACGAGAWSGNRARSALVKMFDPSMVATASVADERALFYSTNRTLEIATTTNFNEGYSVTKYTNLRADGAEPSSTDWVDMDFPLFRVAEAYLTYAEAVFRTGDSSEALIAINQIRARAGATALIHLGLSDILEERAREFFFEGQRRTDLIRFGCYGGGTYLWDWKAGVAAGAAFDAHYNLFPIPQTALDANSSLMQNPGY
jgi:starch-binding outer membrane protein, SusD/RagB family